MARYALPIACRVAAGKAGWGKALPPNTGLGVAVSSAEERQSPTWVAGVAEVTVDTSTGRYKINRLTVAMDPGTVINPRNATAQIQGAALWGASQVMAERLTLKDGGIEQSNFHEYTPVRVGGRTADRRRVDRFRPPPKRSWGACIDGSGTGGCERDLQRCRSARPPHANHRRGGSGRVEKEGLTVTSEPRHGNSGRGINASPTCKRRSRLDRRHSLAVNRRYSGALSFEASVAR